MTQFNDTVEDQSKTAAASGKDFLEVCREHLEEAVNEGVTEYDGESVEDFASHIINLVWEVEEADLKRSFKNGRDYRRERRPSRRSR